jgi:hypothetical protein
VTTFAMGRTEEMPLPVRTRHPLPPPTYALQGAASSPTTSPPPPRQSGTFDGIYCTSRHIPGAPPRPPAITCLAWPSARQLAGHAPCSMCCHATSCRLPWAPL